MKTSPMTAMPLSCELVCQNFLMQVDCMSMFLDTSIKAIAAVGKKLTEKEQHGFHLCILALAQTVEDAVESGDALQEMEASNG